MLHTQPWGHERALMRSGWVALKSLCAVQQEIGEGFARADNTAIKKRKIFKARRGAAPAPVPASEEATAGGKAPASAGSNPFAGISLTPAAAASGNPFAGLSLPAQAAASKVTLLALALFRF